MVAHVLRLRLALVAGALRGDRRFVTRTVIATIIFAAAVAAVIFALSLLHDETLDVAAAVIVTAGSALLLGASVGPIMGGTVDQLDPRRFTTLGINPRTVAWSSMLASVVSVPSIALLIGSGAVAGVWVAQGVGTTVAIVAALAGVTTCIIASRVSMLVASLWKVPRSREVTALFVLAAAIIVIPVGVFFGSLQWGGVLPAPFAAAAEALSFTPFGAVWAVPTAIASGHPAAVTFVIIAVVTLVVLAWGWDRLVARALSTIDKPMAARQSMGMGWFGVFPMTQFGAIAARSLVYWLRDRRYLVNIVIVPIAAIIAVMPLLIAGVPIEIIYLLPVPIMALFFGWIPHNDIAYDSTAVWMHIVSGVRGTADRLGRLVPIFVVAVPILAIVIPISIALHGGWSLAPALIGVAANLFLVGLGLSSISSVIAPYAVTPPGDSPFQQPQRTGSGVGAQALVLLGTIVLSLPSVILATQAMMGEPERVNQALLTGLGIGGVVFVIGIAIGSVLFDRRGAKIMEFAEAS